MSLGGWGKRTESGEVLEIPVRHQRCPEDAELEAVIGLNVRHGRAAQRFGLCVSALAILTIPMAVVLFMLYAEGARGAATTCVLALWMVTFMGASFAALRTARLLAQLDDAARRVGATRSKPVD